jgi:hypothetical protein
LVSTSATCLRASPVARRDVVVGHGDVEDEEDDQDDRESGGGPDPGRGVDVRPSAALRVIVTTLIANAGAFGSIQRSTSGGTTQRSRRTPVAMPDRKARASSTPLMASPSG